MLDTDIDYYLYTLFRITYIPCNGVSPLGEHPNEISKNNKMLNIISRKSNTPQVQTEVVIVVEVTKKLKKLTLITTLELN